MLVQFTLAWMDAEVLLKAIFKGRFIYPFLLRIFCCSAANLPTVWDAVKQLMLPKLLNPRPKIAKTTDLFIFKYLAANEVRQQHSPRGLRFFSFKGR